MIKTIIHHWFGLETVLLRLEGTAIPTSSGDRLDAALDKGKYKRVHERREESVRKVCGKAWSRTSACQLLPAPLEGGRGKQSAGNPGSNPGRRI